MNQMEQQQSGSGVSSLALAMGELEAIAERIEAGGMGLEEGLAQYERGHALLLQCRRMLAEAERRIADLAGEEAAGGAEHGVKLGLDRGGARGAA